MSKKFTNPASQFFSNAEEIAQQAEEEIKERQIGMQEKEENRTRRVQAYLTPSLHARAQEYAKRERYSINDLINFSLEEYLNSNANSN